MTTFPPQRRLSRLPALDLLTMTLEQKAASALIAETFQMKDVPAGPFTVLSRKLSFTEGVLRLFKATREAKLGPRLFEMTVLMIGRHWNAQFEWHAHAKHALECGVSAEVVESIRVGKPPTFVHQDEAVVYELVQELSNSRRLSQDIFDKARSILGEEQLVELVTAAGFYTMIAMIVVGFDIQIPPPAEPYPLPPLYRAHL